MPYLITKGYGPAATSGTLSGSITLDSNKWMNLAIPVEGRKVKEYFVDAVLAIVQTQSPAAIASDIIEVVKAFPASDESVNKYLVYVPDITPAAAEGNFSLVATDGANKEINGFLCKMKDYSALYTGEIIFSWDGNDSI